MSLLASILIAAEEGGHGGITTPYKWWPEPYEIIWGGIASLLVFGALFKFAGPQFKKALAARREGIATDLMKAHNNKVSAEHTAANIRSDKGDIQGERTRLFAEADETAARVLSEGRARIEVEVREAESKGLADIEASKGRVGAEIQGQVATLAAAATEQVVRGSIDAVTQQRLIEDFIAKVGGSR
jgi:F-type H+-transporting ATPase subunit b